jgi:hypothetical protein
MFFMHMLFIYYFIFINLYKSKEKSYWIETTTGRDNFILRIKLSQQIGEEA